MTNADEKWVGKSRLAGLKSLLDIVIATEKAAQTRETFPHM